MKRDHEPYHGIFTIPCTPFHADLNVDEEGLASVVDFACRCGSHGIVWPVLASEFYTLSDSERIRGYPIVVAAAAGRAPVVAGVAGTSIPHAIELATAAAKAGVDAVIAVPPYTYKLDNEGILTYFRAIAAATSLPVFIQNAAAFGSPVSPAFVARIAREIPSEVYVKEEVPPALHRISETVALREPAIKGIFAGHGGTDLIEELRRGAVGNMPGAALADVLVAIYERYRSGDEAGAREIHGHFLIASQVLRQPGGGARVTKEMLVRRGVIRGALTRLPSPPLDDEDRYELDRCLESLSELFRV